MSEHVALPIENPRGLRIGWIPEILFRPGTGFNRVANQTGSVWLTPLLILTLMALLQVIVAGPLKKEAAIRGQVELPPEFQYYSPEQQAQFQQAMAATQSPVFIYVFPAFTSVAGVWVGWLLVGGLVHLALTLLGGRSETGITMNLVAWASLPIAVRAGVRIVYMLMTDQLISAPGLAGFAPAGESAVSMYLAALLALIDLYVIWHVVLLVKGIEATDSLVVGKILAGVLVVIVFALFLQALLSYLITRLSNLTIIRPFF